MIVAYLKPTNYCNVGCDHCYLTEAVRADRFRMSHDVVSQSAVMLRQMADSRPDGSIRVVWHGGEPLTVSVDWYELATSILDKHLPSYSQSIQTSLIPYDGSFAEYIHAHCSGAIGSSVDFSTRTLRGSNDRYLDLWLSKVEHARRDGILVIPGFVPSRHEIGRGEFLLSFFADAGFRDVSLERYNAFGVPHQLRPSNREHSAFLTELLDATVTRLRRGLATPFINVLVASIRGVVYQAPGDRWGGSCQSDFVVVEPNGNLNNCPDKSSHEAAYSHIDSGLPGLQSSMARRRWIRLQTAEHRNPHCMECNYHHWCGGGCPITPQLGENGETECSGYRRYLDEVARFCADPETLPLLIQYAGLGWIRSGYRYVG
jgi:radical SAM protein with 4Fe4S-binding SPASM domain